MKSRRQYVQKLLCVTLLGLSLTMPVLAHGGRMGGWGGCAGAAFDQPVGNGGMGGMRGMGQGGMRGMGGGMAWNLITPEEQNSHRAQMRAVKTYAECSKVQLEHRKLMEERAKEKNISLPAPYASPCDNLKARGFIS